MPSIVRLVSCIPISYTLYTLSTTWLSQRAFAVKLTRLQSITAAVHFSQPDTLYCVAVHHQSGDSGVMVYKGGAGDHTRDQKLAGSTCR